MTLLCISVNNYCSLCPCAKIKWSEGVVFKSADNSCIIECCNRLLCIFRNLVKIRKIRINALFKASGAVNYCTYILSCNPLIRCKCIFIYSVYPAVFKSCCNIGCKPIIGVHIIKSHFKIFCLYILSSTNHFNKLRSCQCFFR